MYLANIDAIIDNNLNVCGMFITHAHEDHIGGASFMATYKVPNLYNSFQDTY